MTAPEGSLRRAFARELLLDNAIEAYQSGLSYIDWEETRADRELLAAVTQRDLDTIFNLVWKGKFAAMGSTG